jgi:hypothetical protein
MGTTIGKGGKTAPRTKTGKTKVAKGLTEFDGHEFLFSEDAKGTVVIGAFKNGRDVVAIMMNEYKGRKKFDIRTCYLDDSDDCWHPTSKGISVRDIDGVYEIMRVLDEHEKEIEQHLMDD